MIRNKMELQRYLLLDKHAMGRTERHPKLFGDVIWKYMIILRYSEYINNISQKSIFQKLQHLLLEILRHKYMEKTGFEIGLNQCGPGLSIAHTSKVILHKNAIVGKNCRIVGDVTLGATNGSSKAPVIGDNVFISVGARIIGDVSVADNVAIAANAVVVKSINEPDTTWGGVPAKKISDNGSRSNFPYLEMMKG